MGRITYKRKKDSGKDKNRGMVILPNIGGITVKLARILKKRKVTTVLRPHITGQKRECIPLIVKVVIGGMLGKQNGFSKPE